MTIGTNNHLIYNDSISSLTWKCTSSHCYIQWSYQHKCKQMHYFHWHGELTCQYINLRYFMYIKDMLWKKLLSGRVPFKTIFIIVHPYFQDCIAHFLIIFWSILSTAHESSSYYLGSEKADFFLASFVVLSN